MKTQWKTHLLPAAAIAMLSAPLFAEVELPTARTLVDAHIAASGGIEVFEQQVNSTTKGRFVMPAAGLEGQLSGFSRAPSERVILIEIEGIGTIHSGYNDGKAWSSDPFMGPRLISGVELDLQIESNELGALIRSDEYVASMQTVGTAEYNGETCYKVNVVWKSGRESVDCYSVENDYLIAQEATIESPMGSIQSVMLFSDYKTFEVDGVELVWPATTSITSMGQEQQLIIDSIELGAPADEYFELPPAIATLMKNEAGETPADE